MTTSNRLPALVATLAAIKANQQQIRTKIQDLGTQHEEGRRALAEAEVRLNVTRSSLEKESGSTMSDLVAAREQCRDLRESQAEFDFVYSSRVANLQSELLDLSMRIPKAKNAVAEAVADSLVGGLLDRTTILQLQRGFAALTLGNASLTWERYLGALIPNPKTSEIEELRASIIREFPVLGSGRGN